MYKNAETAFPMEGQFHHPPQKLKLLSLSPEC